MRMHVHLGCSLEIVFGRRNCALQTFGRTLRGPLWSCESLFPAKGSGVSQRSGSGRHRSRRRHVSVPSVVGSVAVAAAASGALAMPQAAGSTNAESDGSLGAIAQRPQQDVGRGGALDTVAAAGESLTAQTSETAQEAHVRIMEQQRREAAAAAARAEREAKRWLAPVSSYRITAGFGAGGSMWSSRHTGLDFAADMGDEVYALSSGEIIFAGYDGPYGNKIVVRHWDGTEVWYCHLSRFDLRSGEVKPGEVIGRVGSTGNSTGPHLHLEVHPDGGEPVNPRSWLEEQGVSV